MTDINFLYYSGLSLNAAAFNFKPSTTAQPFTPQAQPVPVMQTADSALMANAPAPPSNGGTNSTMAAQSQMSLDGKPFIPQQSQPSRMSQNAVPFIPSQPSPSSASKAMSQPQVSNASQQEGAP